MTPEKNDYHHGNLRTALLEAAADVVEEKGAAAVSLRKLSERVGVSRSAVYRHFEGKSDLLSEIAREGFERLRRTMKAIRMDREGEPDPVLRLRNMGKEYVQFARKNPGHFRLMFGEWAWAPENPGELDEAAARSFDELVEMVRTGQSEGAFHSEDPGDLAFAAWAYVHGIAELALGGHAEDRIDNDEQFDFTLRLLIDGIGHG